jgi:hypothetical protein
VASRIICFCRAASFSMRWELGRFTSLCVSERRRIRCRLSVLGGHGCHRERYRSFEDEVLVAELTGLIRGAERGAASQTARSPACLSRRYELRCL